MELKEAVKQIIEKINRGYVFDSHYVINRLICQKEHSIYYYRFMSKYVGDNGTVAGAHGNLAQVIGEFKDTLVEQLPYDSWSETIHCDGGKCVLWKRI